ncbi:hypothetical protein KEM55_002302, partial [Ascosphaera atra]
REANEARQVLQQYVRLHPRYRFSDAVARDIIQVYIRDTFMLDKKAIISTFRKPGNDSELSVIFATEALGIGVDFPDIRRVVQYKLPNNYEPAVLWQRGGRASRNLQEGCIILLVENWVLGKERHKSKKSAESAELVADNGNEAGDEEEEEELEDEPQTRRVAKDPSEERGDLADIWYSMVNGDSTCCICDLLLDYFKEPEQFRVPKADRQRCCFRCDKGLAYGIVDMDSSPMCYLYNGQGNKGDQGARKVRAAAREWAASKARELTAESHLPLDHHSLLLAESELRTLESKYVHVLCCNSLRDTLVDWEWMTRYEEELLGVIKQAAGFTPSALDAAFDNSREPAFQTLTQRPPAKEVQDRLENPTFKVVPPIAPRTPSKRKALGDITNTPRSRIRKR